MADNTQGDTPQDPKFINYLFTLKKYDCHFLVGNKQLIEPERIGVVTPMLMAHSEVLQSEMVLRDIEDKKCVAVDDMYPDTFRNLLRYVYGHDNTAGLSFEEADNLLYAAEKYMIGTLKARLADRLIKLLNPDNICSLLNNPACYRQLELDSAITEILQNETDKILGSPQFIDLSSNALVKVFEQDTMNVAEIEVWRAAIKWAKHRTNSDNGPDVRKALEGPAKHIRVCTIDDDSFVDVVCPTGVLTDKEINMVHASKIKNVKQNDLIEFSNEIEYRSKSLKPSNLNFSSDFAMSLVGQTSSSCETIDILTKKYAIELLPFIFNSTRWQYTSFVPEGLKQEYRCNIIITRITDYVNNTSTEPPITVEVCKEVEFGAEFTVPVTKDGKNITLLPNNKYVVKITFNRPIICFWNQQGSTFTNEHISVKLPYIESYWRYQGPFKMLYYQPHQVKPITTHIR